jgi:hypothetical protein
MFCTWLLFLRAILCLLKHLSKDVRAKLRNTRKFKSFVNISLHVLSIFPGIDHIVKGMLKINPLSILMVNFLLQQFSFH